MSGERERHAGDAGREIDAAARRGDAEGVEAATERALAGTPGVLFTRGDEAAVVAAFALAHAAHRRGGPAPADGVAVLLGERAGRGTASGLAAALDGLRVLDPACGAGALLAAAQVAAGRCGARLRLLGMDVAPLAARAARIRLGLAGASAEVADADAIAAPWPGADVVLMNPPFVRHELVPAPEKRRAAARTGLPLRADLSAHFVLLGLRHAPVVGLVLPRALETARSAERMRAEGAARGGRVLSLRSRASGGFSASVDTSLVVWVEGASDRPPAESTVPIGSLAAGELAGLARGSGGSRLRIPRPPAPPPRGAARVADACEVRFGLKTGCNAFFHLEPLGGGRYRSPLLGEAELEPGDVAPLLAGLKEAIAPERAEARRVIFRPSPPSRGARDYLARGEAAGVHRRATCAAREPWWSVVPGRGAAPVLYPAKVGARAFAFHNRDALLEDKKWHALFPRGVEPWLLAATLSATPVRLGIDRAARQLTGAQAIADIDCGVLAGAPFPPAAALSALAEPLRPLHDALAGDPVTTDLEAMLERPAQRELDELVGRAMGLRRPEVSRARAELLERVRRRLAHAEGVRATIRGERDGPAR